MDMIKLDPIETRRTYYFPNEQEVTIRNVNAMRISPSGRHRLETTDGKKFIINKGWLAIEIHTAAWTI